MVGGDKPVVVYDGKCGRCRRWVARARGKTGELVEYRPFQEGASYYPEIPPENFTRSVYLITPEGNYYRGAEAIFRTLAYAPGRGFWLWCYRHLPGFAEISEWTYRHMAHRRGK